MLVPLVAAVERPQLMIFAPAPEPVIAAYSSLAVFTINASSPSVTAFHVIFLRAYPSYSVGPVPGSVNSLPSRVYFHSTVSSARYPAPALYLKIVSAEPTSHVSVPAFASLPRPFAQRTTASNASRGDGAANTSSWADATPAWHAARPG